MKIHLGRRHCSFPQLCTFFPRFAAAYTFESIENNRFQSGPLQPEITKTIKWRKTMGRRQGEEPVLSRTCLPELLLPVIIIIVITPGKYSCDEMRVHHDSSLLQGDGPETNKNTSNYNAASIRLNMRKRNNPRPTPN